MSGDRFNKGFMDQNRSVLPLNQFHSHSVLQLKLSRTYVYHWCLCCWWISCKTNRIIRIYFSSSAIIGWTFGTVIVGITRCAIISFVLFAASATAWWAFGTWFFYFGIDIWNIILAITTRYINWWEVSYSWIMMEAFIGSNDMTHII